MGERLTLTTTSESFIDSTTLCTLSRDPLGIKYPELYLETRIFWEVTNFNTDSDEANLQNSSVSNCIVSFLLKENIVKINVRKNISWL